MINRRGYFDYHHSSIDEYTQIKSTNSSVIQEALSKKIDWAGTVVVLIGPDTHTRPWVNWEIAYALKNGKRVVGVYLRGEKDATVPENLDKYGDAMVGWNADAIVDAIRGKNTWNPGTNSMTYDGRSRPRRRVC